MIRTVGCDCDGLVFGLARGRKLIAHAMHIPGKPLHLRPLSNRVPADRQACQQATANMPNIGQGRDSERLGKVAAIRSSAASFQLLPQDLRSIKTKPVWCRAVP